MRSQLSCESNTPTRLLPRVAVRRPSADGADGTFQPVHNRPPGCPPIVPETMLKSIEWSRGIRLIQHERNTRV